MTVYQVVKRGSKWHVHMPGANANAPSSEDKSKIVAWICEVAKEHDAAVQVRDIGGQIEMVYTYVRGVEHRSGRDQPRTSAERYGGKAQRHGTLLRRLLNV